LKKLICANFNEIDLYPNSVPAIGIFDVLEHIENDVSFLTKIQRSLVSGGKLYITVPAYNWLWSDEDNEAGHFRRYTINLLKSKIKQIGLKIEYSTYIFSILPIAIFLFRVLPSKLKLKQNEPQKKTKNEHKKLNGLTGNILHKIWDSELKAISKQESILLGSSCLLVAKK